MGSSSGAASGASFLSVSSLSPPFPLLSVESSSSADTVPAFSVDKFSRDALPSTLSPTDPITTPRPSASSVSACSATPAQLPTPLLLSRSTLISWPALG